MTYRLTAADFSSGFEGVGRTSESQVQEVAPQKRKSDIGHLAPTAVDLLDMFGPEGLSPDELEDIMDL